MALSTLRSLPFSPITERHKIFAFDLLFFLSKEYGIDWTPYGWKCYFTDPLSPWTSDMEEATRIFLRGTEQKFLRKYAELVPESTPGHSQIFWTYCREILYHYFNRRSTPAELFDTIVYVGRLSVTFYRYKIYDAPSFAVVEIGECLQKYIRDYGPGVFPALQEFAFSIIQDHQK